jgi:uncharacterized membrane protein
MFSTDILGRLHPLLVHLPIGILLFAAALLLLERFKKTDFGGATGWALLLGAVSAALSCGAGWLLAQSGEYDADLVFKHQWTGIATAALGFGAYFFKNFRGVLTAATVGVMSVAGHYGGSITHGEDYLFPKKKTPSVKTDVKVDSAQVAQMIGNPIVASDVDSTNAVAAVGQPIERRSFLYRDMVVPILENKCYSCHSEKKKKGGLRLDSEAFINAGGENGSILSAGKPETSHLFSYLTLPDDDDLHMPPKGKPQLTAQEIATIHFWIKKGAPFGEVVEKIEATAANGANAAISAANAPLVIPSLPKSATVKSPISNLQSPIANLEQTILDKKIEAAPPSVLDKLKQQNVSMTTFGAGSNYLTANFVNVKNYNSAVLDELKSIDNQIVRIKLSNLPVTDADVQKLSNFKNLTRLNLDKTAVTDVGLAHLKNLPNLEQLNLYGSNVTDAGITALANCKNLKVVYLWQTKITEGGVAELKKALPNVVVELGGFQFPKLDTGQLRIKN